MSDNKPDIRAIRNPSLPELFDEEKEKLKELLEKSFEEHFGTQEQRGGEDE